MSSAVEGGNTHEPMQPIEMEDRKGADRYSFACILPLLQRSSRQNVSHYRTARGKSAFPASQGTVPLISLPWVIVALPLTDSFRRIRL